MSLSCHTYGKQAANYRRPLVRKIFFLKLDASIPSGPPCDSASKELERAVSTGTDVVAKKQIGFFGGDETGGFEGVCVHLVRPGM